jgi:outer membrane murein-binding lipoprotein Lpp
MRRPAVVLAAALLLAGCQQRPSSESQRLERLELRVQQLEQRQAQPNAANTADQAGKPPAGTVKSLTFRMNTSDDRLRIYWADGSTSDLPCTKEQSTWACG